MDFDGELGGPKEVIDKRVKASLVELNNTLKMLISVQNSSKQAHENIFWRKILMFSSIYYFWYKFLFFVWKQKIELPDEIARLKHRIDTAADAHSIGKFGIITFHSKTRFHHLRNFSECCLVFTIFH